MPLSELLTQSWLPEHNATITLLAAIFGLMLGSFLNVVGLRQLKDESVVFPASHCTSCNKPLGWVENIPVISYLVLMGKCKGCKAPISPQYPIIELLTGALLAYTVWRWGVSLPIVLLAFLFANLVAILITDWRESLIFHANTLPLLPAGLAFAALNPLHETGLTYPGYGWLDALLGILVAVAVFEGMIWLSRKLMGTDGFGHGDTLLMMGVGAYFGWRFTLAAIIAGFIVQSIAALPLMLTQWLQQKRYALLGSGAAALGLALLPLLIPISRLPEQLALTAMCMAASLVAVGVFLVQVRKTETYTYLPLGPALIAATFILLFAGSWLGRFVPGVSLL
ncbi:MAG: prepilin peptidase [Vampirovibrionales bacterium]|nr:prepilin peptidase [Vampirovibrionales bacterium]